MKRQHRAYSPSDSGSASYSNSDSESDGELHCISCLEVYVPHDVSICKECFDGFGKVQDELLKEINVLTGKLDFLRSSMSEGNPRPFTDVVLFACMNGVASLPIPAHKAVLVSRSPVFKAMLESDMEESRTGKIKICDVSYDILENFINYLYTTEARFSEQMACDLLAMSEKYQVKHLKDHCEKFLIAKLHPEKSLMFYAFAYQFDAKGLLGAALAMILETMEHLTTREEYKGLVDKYPLLIVEIYEAYLFKRTTGGAI